MLSGGGFRGNERKRAARRQTCRQPEYWKEETFTSDRALQVGASIRTSYSVVSGNARVGHDGIIMRAESSIWRRLVGDS